VARFEVANNKAGTINSANVTYWQFKTASTSRARIFEIGLSVSTAPATNGPSWRLVRATAVGTSTATVTAEEEDPGGGAATAVLDTTWSVNPTLASVDMRRYATPTAIGSGIVWTWPDHRPLIVPVSSGICIVNANSPGTTGNAGNYNIYVIFEE
jgi:hypothetical protein